MFVSNSSLDIVFVTSNTESNISEKVIFNGFFFLMLFCFRKQRQVPEKLRGEQAY